MMEVGKKIKKEKRKNRNVEEIKKMVERWKRKEGKEGWRCNRNKRKNKAEMVGDCERKKESKGSIKICKQYWKEGRWKRKERKKEKKEEDVKRK